MSKPEIHLSFDDASIHDLKLADLLTKHGLTATFYIPYYWEDYNRSKGTRGIPRTKLKALSKKFEIGSHTLTHPLLTRIPYGQAEYEIIESRNKLEDLLGVEVTKFSYPRGYATDQLVSIVRRNYEHGRSTLVGNVEPPIDPAWEHTSVHLACERREYGKLHWFDYGIKHLEKSQLKSGGYFHAWGHSAEIDKNNAWDMVDRFLGMIARVYDTHS